MTDIGSRIEMISLVAPRSVGFASFAAQGSRAARGPDTRKASGITPRVGSRRWCPISSGVLKVVPSDSRPKANPNPPKKRMGAWLKVCGEAIYSTRPYSVFGEGPSLADQRSQHDHHTVYTGEHIRFTRNKANTVLYATALDWPGEKMVITTLADADLSGLGSVRLLGVEGELTWEPSADGLEIVLPAQPAYGMSFPVRLEFKKQIP